MRLMLAAALLMGAYALPAQAQTPLKPILTFQVQPLERLLAGARQTLQSLGGAEAAKEFDAETLAFLGPKGLQGLDLGRPITGYQVVIDKPDDVAFVVLVPITSKADALDLFHRGKANYEPTQDDPELYEPKNPEPDTKVFARFVGNICYMGVSVPKTELDPKTLPTAASLTLPNEGSWLAVVNHLDRVRPADRQKLIDAFVKLGNDPKRPPLPAEVKQNADIESFSRRYAKVMYEQGKTAAYRIDFDPKKLTFAMDFQFTPQPGTPAVATIAARQPTMNRYASVVSPDAVAGIVMQLPTFDAETRENLAIKISGRGENPDAAPVPKKTEPDSWDEFSMALLDGFGRAAKTGQIDVAVAVRGPIDGTYSIAAGITVDNATQLTAKLRKLPPAERENITFNVYQADGIAVHEIRVADLAPDWLSRFAGKQAKVHLAFTKNGILATYGNDSLRDIKALLSATEKPQPAGVFEVRINPKRLRPLMILAGGGELTGYLPSDAKDELQTVVKLAVTGGQKLGIRLEFVAGLAPDNH